ncbi:hypothetical protein HPP92_006352 [Vanilla planifolia]|uniref:Scarecrow-like protein 9 n=1 Tax=Vanilla planifolia TaxID=51239 RepID=A0A835V6P7_VANPL|nr:hypothetical protein HPP92_006352 [Vanilla planifolia]
MEEAQKFLPSEDQLAVGLDLDTFALQHESDTKEHECQKEDSTSNSLSWGRKKPQTEENLDLKEGKALLSAAYSDENGAHKGSQNGNTKSSIHGGKAQRKRQQKKDAVDLSSLLIYCAQAVAADDRQMANELLKQIRQNSSPFGDGNQRLAHCFADGLEARLAGTGSLIYNSLVAKRTTAADILKGYQLYITACPFLRISHSFSNHTILHVAENASRVHIVDFGIYFGFQWPCLIHRMSMRPGGPPKLRITGIDSPQPGFRPAERIEETGRRLADYARSFNVPFEYNGIASKWEAIREALFHYSAMFDMLDTTVARDDAQRLLLERDLFGCAALNVVSCEGSERVERPETHKQWQVRNLRVGFKQLQPIPDIMKKAMAKVRSCYHKDFVIDEDAGWLLQGWKGRIIYALSTWKPNK